MEESESALECMPVLVRWPTLGGRRRTNDQQTTGAEQLSASDKRLAECCGTEKSWNIASHQNDIKP